MILYQRLQGAFMCLFDTMTWDPQYGDHLSHCVSPLPWIKAVTTTTSGYLCIAAIQLVNVS